MAGQTTSEGIFNSEEYAWKDLKLVFAGRPVTGFRGIKYKTSRVTTEVYASGEDPHAITRGNKSYSGEITLLQSEIEALIIAVQAAYGKSKDLTDPFFDATVVYASELGGVVTTDQITKMAISDLEKAMKQGDPNMEITLPFKAGKINYNV